MAEFCIDCWNKLCETNDPAKKFIFSRELELCEECGEMKRTIAAIRKRYLFKEWIDELIEGLKRLRCR